MLWTHTWDTLGSNLSQDRAILTGVSSGFPQSLQANAGTAPRLGHDHFRPHPFHFISHPITQCNKGCTESNDHDRLMYVSST
jgi:hypothetical protein